MSISSDTDDLISTSLWGEVVTIMRNDPKYGDIGTGTELWSIISEPNADIQRIAGNNPTRNLGQDRISSHRIFLPDGTNVKQGDRIRSADWDVGKAVHFVLAVMADEGHTEIMTKLVRAQLKSTLKGPLGLLLALSNMTVRE